jgi:acetyl esterase/lipase
MLSSIPELPEKWTTSQWNQWTTSTGIGGQLGMEWVDNFKRNGWTTSTVPRTNITPEGIRITPDVVYGHKFGMALTFDMFQPENQNGAGVILINSGGWRSRLPNFYEYTADGIRLKTQEIKIEPFLSKGFTIFWVRHGSRPKFEIPEIVADLRRAVRFIRFHASEYGVDKEKIGILGGSTGGLLSLLLGTTSEICNSEATEEFEKDTGRVAAIVANFPITDLKRLTEHRGGPPPIDHPLRNLTEEQFKEFSPLYFASSDDPPTLIIHGDKDINVPIIEGESMYQELLKSGVESKFVIIPGAGHRFEGEDADLALSEAVSWFEEHLVEKQ